MKSSPTDATAAQGVAIIVQARMGSSRLPGKVLRAISGMPMLAYQLERMRRSSRASGLVIATSTDTRDDVIEAFCAENAVACWRGPEQDVLRRYAGAARACGAGAIVRITADCPLIDADLIDAAIAAFGTPGLHHDFLSNMIEPTWPYGMAVEVMTSAALYEADREAKDPDEREHVTPFMYRRPERFRIKSLTRMPDLSRHRWTVDTNEDFELVSRILTAMYPRKPDFTMTDVLALLDENPDWTQINRHVVQKTLAPVRGGSR